MQSNKFEGSTMKKPTANDWQDGECSFKPIIYIIGEIQIITTCILPPCNANQGIKNLDDTALLDLAASGIYIKATAPIEDKNQPYQ